MKVTGAQPTGESMLRTLIELLEAQEEIKIKYEIVAKEARDEKTSITISNTAVFC